MTRQARRHRRWMLWIEAFGRAGLFALLLSIVGCDFQWHVEVPRAHSKQVQPVKKREFRVLILEDSKSRNSLPSPQRLILTAKTVRDYLNQYCVKGPDGKTPEWRILDYRDTLDGVWAEVVAAGPAASYPWMWVSDGTDGFSGPLVEDIDRFLQTVKPYAEGK